MRRRAIHVCASYNVRDIIETTNTCGQAGLKLSHPPAKVTVWGVRLGVPKSLNTGDVKASTRDDPPYNKGRARPCAVFVPTGVRKPVCRSGVGVRLCALSWGEYGVRIAYRVLPGALGLAPLRQPLNSEHAAKEGVATVRCRRRIRPAGGNLLRWAQQA